MMIRTKTFPTRRQFLGTTAALSGLAVAPRPLFATLGPWGTRPEPVPSIQDRRVEALVQRALDAARRAGASYADVRLTYTKQREFLGSGLPEERERLGAGVRALINGYWGFASSPLWTRDEMDRLAREAVRQAKVNSLNKPREIVFPSSGPAVRGHWETPVEIDAFTIHPLEVRDRFDGMNAEMRLALGYKGKFGIVPGGPERLSTAMLATFTIQEKAFGSTDGSYVTQRLHRSNGAAGCGGTNIGDYPSLWGSVGSRLDVASAGWEMFAREPILDLIRAGIEASGPLGRLPVKPIEVGRYNAVFSASSVAGLLSTTVGAATEIDRVLGYEANAGGTSYLNAPDEMLGTFALGNEQLTVTANRTEAGGAATTKWDDEGVAPEAFTLIKNGVVQDFQTSREGAGWLKDTYARAGRSVRSHGCAFAESGHIAPMIHTANLVMQPGAAALTAGDLETRMGTGISVEAMIVDPDFQRAGGNCYKLFAWEIKGGKRVARLTDANILFRTTEIWKNILAAGGPASAERSGFDGIAVTKGEPVQTGVHSVTAVPMLVRDVAFIDATKR